MVYGFTFHLRNIEKSGTYMYFYEEIEPHTILQSKSWPQFLLATKMKSSAFVDVVHVCMQKMNLANSSYFFNMINIPYNPSKACC